MADILWLDDQGGRWRTSAMHCALRAIQLS